MWLNGVSLKLLHRCHSNFDYGPGLRVGQTPESRFAPQSSADTYNPTPGVRLNWSGEL